MMELPIRSRTRECDSHPILAHFAEWWKIPLLDDRVLSEELYGPLAVHKAEMCVPTLGNATVVTLLG